MDEKQYDRLINKYWCLYQTDVQDTSFIWRELSRAEYNKIIRLYDNEYDREEQVCRLCVLEPKGFDFENCDAGIPSALAEHILAESGYSKEPSTKIQDLLGVFRAEMTGFENQVSCIIHEAFPTLDIEDIELWPLEKTLWYFSRAEYILNGLRGLDLQQQQSEAPSGPNYEDFPELAQEKAFMEGKLRKKSRG